MNSSVLIIDDEKPVRDMLSLYLRSEGYQVTEYGDGKDALASCTEQLPDLVLSDLRMPGGMDGLEVLKQLQQDYPGLPVIVVSGTGEMEDAIQALKLGACDFLLKPFPDLAVLSHAIFRALERTRLLRENQAYREHLETANTRLAASLHQMEEDEASGRRVQFALLPPQKKNFGGFECSYHIATSSFLSGDFVDYFSIDQHRFALYIIDVSGHGISSAVITVLVNSLVGRYLENYRNYNDPTILDPARLLHALNQKLINGGHGKYLTMFYLIIDQQTETMRCANAGQYPFPFYSDGEQVEQIGGNSCPVGLFEAADYRNLIYPITYNFALRLFSDGVLELLPESSLDDRKQHLQQLSLNPKSDAHCLADALQLEQHSSLPDDASILCLRRCHHE